MNKPEKCRCAGPVFNPAVFLTVKLAAFILTAVLAMSLLAGCKNNENSGLTYKIQPGMPDLTDYDVIFVGENHISSQIFDIELDLMRYYYSLGIRDFALECSFGEALFFQYYFETGDEECYQYINRYSGTEKITAFSRERAEFYRNIYQWNSTLEQKIRIHGFDIEHDPYGTGIAAAWFFILKKYDPIEGMPLFTGDGIWPRAGNWYRLIEDYRTNSERYSAIGSEDTELFEKIILNVEQGLIANNRNSKISVKENQKRSAVLREQFMTMNFRELMEKNPGKKVLAIMGYMHSALTGNAIYTINESQFPWVSTDEPCMASVLKNETRIASIVMRTFGNSGKWPFFIRIRGWDLAEPYTSSYSGKWPNN